MLRAESRVRCFNIELAENRQIKANITNVEFLVCQLEVVLCNVSTPDAQKADVPFNVPTSC